MRLFTTLSLFMLGTTAAMADDSTGRPAPLKITAASDARTVIRGIPEEAATERFEVLAASGETVSYVGLADGPVGGVVFKGGKLHGTLTRAQAETFYACRGYATARHHYWAQEAGRWTDSLVRVAEPAPDVELTFTGKSTMKSIKAVLENPAINQVKALVEMGTNPLKVIKVLSKARSEHRQREHDEDMLEELGKLMPGDAEQRLADVLRPEDLTFLERGLVMAYPKYSVEFMVDNNKIQALQQPSFLQLARVKPGMFYAPNTVWSNCTPEKWIDAMAPAAAPASASVMAAPPQG
ncbi:hypothetical protein ACFFTM_25235 [Pseudoduganella plicata]|uniref:Uncharacterized protein n=1 Tax=Pseudoduganella plicata TaxID=321984 RepID=A0A4P7BFJ8_9BURK|nr:hypothetical protein [Pseudoduganella plicata]QBQ37531.1 hypothetical protein E1742_16170 [Pseudoduganella plicata]GGY91008.1 hypothetical protein GCM10007388_25320 [Pseudoduganella plicata]